MRALPGWLNDTLRWLLSLAVSVWVLLALEHDLRAELHTQVWAEHAFLLGLSLWLAPLLGLPWLIARRFKSERSRGAVWALGSVSLSGALLFGFVGRGLAHGDGIQDLALPAWVVQAGFGVAGAVLGLGIWWLGQRGSWAALCEVLIACGLLRAVLEIDRTYGLFASALVCFGAISLAQALERGVRKLAFERALVLCMFALCAVVFPIGRLTMYEAWATGRHAVLMEQRVPLELDSLLWGNDAGARKAVTLRMPAPALPCPNRKNTPWPALALAPEQRRHVLLISIDALRDDVIDARVDGREVAPNLHAFADRAQRAPHASTSYAATFFAVTGALTGLSASAIALSPTPPKTVFAASASAVAERLIVMPKGSAFEREAFVRYALGGARLKSASNATQQTSLVLKTLRKARATGSRSMAWVHYAETHAPYRKHAGFDFGADPRGLYLSEVAYVDTQVGRLLSGLEAMGALSDTLVILFADHGEALGERGYFGHHVFLNRWIAEVPVMVHAPGGLRIIPTDAQTLDIAPTVLHFLNVVPPHLMQGQSMFREPDPKPRSLVAEAFSTGGASLLEFATHPIADQAELARRMLLVQAGFGRYAPSVSIVRGKHRLIVNRRLGVTSLYDRTLDPNEEHDLSISEPALRAELLEELSRWHAAQSQAAYCATAGASVR